jgi:hypothetical protein
MGAGSSVPPDSRAAWHELLAALPEGAAPRRKPVVSAEAAVTPGAEAMAGWEELVLELSAGAAGLRVLHVVLDAAGRPLTGSDHVLYRRPAGEGDGGSGAPAEMLQESIGGRFEPDGTFRGTCWRVAGPEPAEGEDPRWEMTPREPTEAEVTALAGLVAELLRRGGTATTAPPVR